MEFADGPYLLFWNVYTTMPENTDPPPHPMQNISSLKKDFCARKE